MIAGGVNDWLFFVPQSFGNMIQFDYSNLTCSYSSNVWLNDLVKIGYKLHFLSCEYWPLKWGTPQNLWKRMIFWITKQKQNTHISLQYWVFWIPDSHCTIASEPCGCFAQRQGTCIQDPGSPRVGDRRGDWLACIQRPDAIGRALQPGRNPGHRVDACGHGANWRPKAQIWASHATCGVRRYPRW